MEKFKGIVREGTFNEIIRYGTEKVSHDTNTKRVYFSTRKSDFFAIQKNAKYWCIYMIYGKDRV